MDDIVTHKLLGGSSKKLKKTQKKSKKRPPPNFTFFDQIWQISTNSWNSRNSQKSVKFVNSGPVNFWVRFDNFWDPVKTWPQGLSTFGTMSKFDPRVCQLFGDMSKLDIWTLTFFGIPWKLWHDSWNCQFEIWQLGNFFMTQLCDLITSWSQMRWFLKTIHQVSRFSKSAHDPNWISFRIFWQLRENTNVTFQFFHQNLRPKLGNLNPGRGRGRGTYLKHHPCAVSKLQSVESKWERRWVRSSFVTNEVWLKRKWRNVEMSRSDFSLIAQTFILSIFRSFHTFSKPFLRAFLLASSHQRVMSAWVNRVSQRRHSTRNWVIVGVLIRSIENSRRAIRAYCSCVLQNHDRSVRYLRSIVVWDLTCQVSGFDSFHKTWEVHANVTWFGIWGLHFRSPWIHGTQNLVKFDSKPRIWSNCKKDVELALFWRFRELSLLDPNFDEFRPQPQIWQSQKMTKSKLEKRPQISTSTIGWLSCFDMIRPNINLASLVSIPIHGLDVKFWPFRPILSGKFVQIWVEKSWEP